MNSKNNDFGHKQRNSKIRDLPYTKFKKYFKENYAYAEVILLFVLDLINSRFFSGNKNVRNGYF